MIGFVSPLRGFCIRHSYGHRLVNALNVLRLADLAASSRLIRLVFNILIHSQSSSLMYEVEF